MENNMNEIQNTADSLREFSSTMSKLTKTLAKHGQTPQSMAKLLNPTTYEKTTTTHNE